MVITGLKVRKQPQVHYPFKNVSLSERRVGKIQISESILLDWLQFPKGKIRGIYFDEMSSLGTITIILQDKEMPVVKEGNCIPVITPSYKATFNKRGRITKVTREKL